MLNNVFLFKLNLKSKRSKFHSWILHELIWRRLNSKLFEIQSFKNFLNISFKLLNSPRLYANINFNFFNRSKCDEVWYQYKWLILAVWIDRSIRCEISIIINVKHFHINALDFFHEFVKDVDKFFNNYTEIVFNNFLIKKCYFLISLQRNFTFFNS